MIKRSPRPWVAQLVEANTLKFKSREDQQSSKIFSISQLKVELAPPQESECLRNKRKTIPPCHQQELTSTDTQFKPQELVWHLVQPDLILLLRNTTFNLQGRVALQIPHNTHNKMRDISKSLNKRDIIWSRLSTMSRLTEKMLFIQSTKKFNNSCPINLQESDFLIKLVF